jgi:hypothetical protein
VTNARIAAALRGNEEKLVIRLSEIANGATFYAHILGLGRGSGRGSGVAVVTDPSKHTKQMETVEELMRAFAATAFTTAADLLASASASASNTSSEAAEGVEGAGRDAKDKDSKVLLKKGKNVLALFDDKSGAGPCWFRAKVEEPVPIHTHHNAAATGNKVKVHFIDYGNK